VLIAETFSYAVLVMPFPCNISYNKAISIFLVALLGFFSRQYISWGSSIHTFCWCRGGLYVVSLHGHNWNFLICPFIVVK
jgi:hypothetical protein